MSCVGQKGDLIFFFRIYNLVNDPFLAQVKEKSGVTAGPSYYADNTVNGRAGSKH